MSAMDDVFGAMPHRPDHPDFWRLSEIVLGYDGGMGEADDKDDFFDATVGAVIDKDSLYYHALQRAMRVYNIKTRADMRNRAMDLAILTTIYTEGFCLGADFQKRGGHQ